jgi:peptidoglycan hydrolase-like protein with peptidoglycan-binding domain
LWTIVVFLLSLTVHFSFSLFLSSCSLKQAAATDHLYHRSQEDKMKQKERLLEERLERELQQTLQKDGYDVIEDETKEIEVDGSYIAI